LRMAGARGDVAARRHLLLVALLVAAPIGLAGCETCDEPPYIDSVSVTSYQAAPFLGDWVVVAPAEVTVGAGDTARVIVHVCDPEAVDAACHPKPLVTAATAGPSRQTPAGNTITAQLNSGSHVAIDSRSAATQTLPDSNGSLTWEWLATPDTIGQWEFSLNVATTGGSPEIEQAMTIPINAYRIENHCRPG